MEWPAAFVALGRAGACAQLIAAARAAAARPWCWRPRSSSRCWPTAGGRPLPYRVGECLRQRPAGPRRLRGRQPAVDAMGQEEAVDSLPPKTDPDAREATRKPVEPVVEKLSAPACRWCRRGQPIAERQLDLLQEEHQAYVRQPAPDRSLRAAASRLFLIFSLLAARGRPVRGPLPAGLAAEPAQDRRRLRAWSSSRWLLVLLLSQPPWHAVAGAADDHGHDPDLAYNPQFALLMSFSLALAMTVALGTSLESPAGADGRPGDGGPAAAQRPHAHAARARSAACAGAGLSWP